ncbi:MAG: exo-alpha-sialidase [Rubrivivax sp.]
MNDRAWIATRKGLFEMRLHGGAWQIERTSFLGEPVSMVLPPQAGDGFMLAALNLGHFGVKVHASADAGATWEEVATPAFPPQPEGAEGPPWKLVQIWSLAADVAGTLWAGTLPGGLFRSADRGRSWQLVESLWARPERLEWFGGGYDVPGIHSICPHPQRAGELLVGISCGGAWITRDDGASWALSAQGMRAGFMPPEQADNQNIQDPHRIVRCVAQPEVLWCQHHGGIWRSIDDGANWVEVQSAPVSSFGFAVAVHPDDPATAWFVPAQADERRVPVDGALVVNRTRDGGASFETLRAGLPQAYCYDLVYRHGLAVGGDGRTLLLGSTTGGLWASADAGDRWDPVSARLPPIFAVALG